MFVRPGRLPSVVQSTALRSTTEFSTPVLATVNSTVTSIGKFANLWYGLNVPSLNIASRPRSVLILILVTFSLAWTPVQPIWWR